MIDVLGLLFPRHCPICDNVLNFNGEKICRECRKKLVYIRQPKCMKCGKQLMKNEQEYCFDCKSKKHFYKCGLAGFSHTGDIKKSIYKIKYEGKREYIDFYVDEICRMHLKEILDWNCDAIIPIPLHRKRRIKRGYNQAEIIGKRISYYTGIPLRNDILKRVKNTKPQKELNDFERKKNLENAFKIKKNVVKLKKVILVDDIYTTGSTIDACADILLKNGMGEIHYICLSIGTGY